MIDLKAQAQRGILISGKVWNLGDYLDYWLGEVVRKNQRATTYSRYECAVRLHIKPGLGGNKLDRLSVPLVQSFLNEKLLNGASVRNIHVMREVLSAALTHAQREELVNRNVARLVTLPTYEPDEVRPWSADEASHFLDTARATPYHLAFTLLMLYGLRRGEVLGIRWEDIDFAAGEIHIRQQVQHIRGVLYEAPLKTKAGKRNLPLLAVIHDLLVAHRQKVSESSGLIFTAEDGTPFRPQTLSRAFLRLSQTSGLRTIRLHDLRHTANTLLKKLGVPARDRQFILGHANISTTQGIYEHDDMESRRENLEKIEKLLLSEHESVGDGQRSRQNGRQGVIYTRRLSPFTTVNLAGVEGFEPPALGFGDPSRHSLTQRLTSVDRVVQAHRRTWKLGCVAVKMAVKDSGLELAA
ncbi:site-specific integrase [Streptomyces sp. NPDC093970]|uniref:tyrosine-type recombinase/integrase n=1 Tax=Streptomyces sp. NPDC093970 TaxID=3155076 RepID=UPI0034266974